MELRQTLEGSDLTEIRDKTNALQQAAQPLAQAVYTQASTGATGNGGEAESGAEDEVVEDADYEVIDEDETAKRS
jgi:molecular chaperone DnaK